MFVRSCLSDRDRLTIFIKNLLEWSEMHTKPLSNQKFEKKNPNVIFEPDQDSGGNLGEFEELKDETP